VRAGNAWRQTRRERSGVAGRRTSDRSEDARVVVGRAATTGRVDEGSLFIVIIPSVSAVLGCV